MVEHHLTLHPLSLYFLPHLFPIAVPSIFPYIVRRAPVPFSVRGFHFNGLSPYSIIHFLLGEFQVENRVNVYLKWYFLFLHFTKMDLNQLQFFFEWTDCMQSYSLLLSFGGRWVFPHWYFCLVSHSRFYPTLRQVCLTGMCVVNEDSRTLFYGSSNRIADPMAERSKARVSDRSLAGILDSSPAGDKDICLFWMVCVVR